MAFNIQPIPWKLTGQDYGAVDYAQALRNGFKGYQELHEAANTPKRLSEALLAAKLKNAHDRTINEYLPRSEEARIGATESNTGLDKFRRELMQAQTNRANRPAAVQQSTLEKAVAGLERIKQQYGEDSPYTKNAQSYVEHLAQGANATGAGAKIPNSRLAQLLYLKNNPNLIPQVQNEGSFIPSIQSNEQNQYSPTKPLDIDKALSEAIQGNNNQDYKYSGEAKNVLDAKRLRETDPESAAELDKRLARKEVTQASLDKRRDRLSSGLKPGETEVFDPATHQSIGIKRPYTAAEKKAVGGRQSFNVLYPHILKSTAYYSGTGSLQRFNDDIAHFDTNKKAHQRIVNYLAAIKELTAGSLKENATLAGPSTNQNVSRLYGSLKASDLPTTYEELQKQFRLPYKAQIEAGQLFSRKLNEATKASENIPAHHIEYDEPIRTGNIVNEKTGQLETVEVSPEHWDEFVKAGGY